MHDAAAAQFGIWPMFICRPPQRAPSSVALLGLFAIRPLPTHKRAGDCGGSLRTNQNTAKGTAEVVRCLQLASAKAMDFAKNLASGGQDCGSIENGHHGTAAADLPDMPRLQPDPLLSDNNSPAVLPYCLRSSLI